jgi:hypothetical protein
MLESTLNILIQSLVTEWGWALAVAIATLALKDTVLKLWEGLMFLYGNDFNIDDVVWINGNKKARIVRQGIWKTTFYLYDHNRKFLVPNDRIWTLNIEKELPKEADRNLF